MGEQTKYNGMEPYLHGINQNFVSISRDDKKKNNIILFGVIEPLVEKMREKDTMFDKLYDRIFFGGSYYDGLKVGAPDEYDIDLLLKFPSKWDPSMCDISNVEVVTSNAPGYVHLHLHKTDGFKKYIESGRNRNISYLNAKEILQWMEGVVQKGLNCFGTIFSSRYTFYSAKYGNIYVIKVQKQGPAFTLKIKTEDNTVEMSVDLVPGFVFNQDKWPKNGFVQNPFPDMGEFFVVPKTTKGVSEYDGRYWRLSFQKQERELLHDLGRLKPALKLLKKLRDVQHKHISSYFLKTVVLWEVKNQSQLFWINNSLSYVFMHILKQYRNCLTNKKLPYYWNKNWNILKDVKGDWVNICNRLNFIINQIDNKILGDPSVAAKYILTPEELRKLFTDPEVQEEGSTCIIL